MFLQNFLYTAAMMQYFALVAAYVVHTARKACAESEKHIYREYHDVMDRAMMDSDIEKYEITYRSFRHFVSSFK